MMDDGRTYDDDSQWYIDTYSKEESEEAQRCIQDNEDRKAEMSCQLCGNYECDGHCEDEEQETVESEYDKFLVSKKKVCSRDQLLRTLSAIYWFGISEGQGGEYGFGVGSGLRRAGFPLYDMPKSWRHAILNHLIGQGLIVSEDSVEGEYQKLFITKLGKQVLDELENRKWYKRTTFQPTSMSSGFTNTGTSFLTDKEYEDARNSNVGVIMTCSSRTEYSLLEGPRGEIK